MAYEYLFISTNEATNLGDFARKFFPALNIDNYEERESSNYVGNLYYKATAEDVVLKLSVCDEDDFDDLNFSVFIKGLGELEEQERLLSHVEEIVRLKLKPGGLRVVRALNYGTPDVGRLEY